VEYEKLPLFYSSCKIIGHDLSNCRRLQQDTNVAYGGEKTVGVEIQQLYRPKVASVKMGVRAL